MITRVWHADHIKNHLLAIRSGVQASAPIALIRDNDGHLAAYGQGCNAVIQYLADRFGIKLDGAQTSGEFSLKTWNRAEIEHNLKVASLVIHSPGFISADQAAILNAYYLGINDTLRCLALSFGIETFSLPGNGSSGRQNRQDQGRVDHE